GARDTVPAEHSDRTLYVHNASVTLMRTSVEECRELGRRIAERLNTSNSGAGITVFIPEAGFSGIDVQGQAFFDEEADAALIEELVAALDPSIPVVRRAVPINDRAFAIEMAETLHAAIQNNAK
ncbi:MAG TPA: Tm-1-like ATP-binding domain-containing protein, partial [Homoserinimonas sp.]|nr:Tm-1-like ATP-binding domain-containing protein [Homoserinimonas sp.]